jgi:hypothetical protein
VHIGATSDVGGAAPVLAHSAAARAGHVGTKAGIFDSTSNRCAQRRNPHAQ